MSNSKTANRVHLSAIAMLAPLALAAHAEDVPWPPEAESAVTVSTLIRQPLPARFCLADSAHVSVRAAFDAALIARLERDVGLVRFAFKAPQQTDSRLDRLIAEGRLSFFSLMKTESTDVFFGVNERGRLGIHFDASSLMSPE